MRLLILLLSSLSSTAWGGGKGGPPPWVVRLAAGFLGALAGWFLAGVPYAPDAAHRVVGFPLPVFLRVKAAEGWMDPMPAATLPFLFLDLLLGALLAARILDGLWRRWSPGPVRRARR